MKEEFEALQWNHTWSLVPPKIAGKVASNKWIYRMKYNPNGIISKHNARLVANRFH